MDQESEEARREIEKIDPYIRFEDDYDEYLEDRESPDRNYGYGKDSDSEPSIGF